jgi:hypothetical protein
MQVAALVDLVGSESPRFAGRAVTALAADPEVLAKAGRVLVAAELATEYGFVDIDGYRPPSLRRRAGGGQADPAPAPAPASIRARATAS